MAPRTAHLGPDWQEASFSVQVLIGQAGAIIVTGTLVTVAGGRHTEHVLHPRQNTSYQHIMSTVSKWNSNKSQG